MTAIENRFVESEQSHSREGEAPAEPQTQKAPTLDSGRIKGEADYLGMNDHTSTV